MLKLSKVGRRNPILANEKDQGELVFTVEIFQRVPWLNLFGTGPENVWEIRHIFYFVICQIVVFMRSTRINEIKRLYQSGCHFRQDQRCQERFSPDAEREEGVRVLNVDSLADEREANMDSVVLRWVTKGHFFTVWTGSFFCSQLKKVASEFYCSSWKLHWEEVDNSGNWMTCGRM